MNRPEGGEGFPWNLAVAAGIGVGVERRRGETVHRAPLQVALGCAVLALGIAGAAWVAGCRRPDRTEAPGHTETTSAAGVQRYRLTGRVVSVDMKGHRAVIDHQAHCCARHEALTQQWSSSGHDPQADPVRDTVKKTDLPGVYVVGIYPGGTAALVSAEAREANGGG